MTDYEDCQYNDIGNGVDGWWSCEVRPCPVCVTGEEEPAWMDALNRWLFKHDWMPLIVWMAVWGGLLALCIVMEG